MPTPRTPARIRLLKLTAEAVIQGSRVKSEKTGGVPKLVEPGDLTATTEESQVTLNQAIRFG